MVMPSNSKTDAKLWSALDSLHDDLLDPNVPAVLVDEALRLVGLDPAAVATRALDFVGKIKEERRLEWQRRSLENRRTLEARAARAERSAPMHRTALLARLEELRAADASVGAAIKMAARKRKPEESSDDELRELLAEMEALRAMEGDDSE